MNKNENLKEVLFSKQFDPFVGTEEVAFFKDPELMQEFLVRFNNYPKLEAEIARCKEIAERDGADYSALLKEKKELEALNMELVSFVNEVINGGIYTSEQMQLRGKKLLEKAKGGV